MSLIPNLKDAVLGQVKGEYKKHPEVKKALDEAEAGLLAASNFFARLSPQAIEKALLMLNELDGSPFSSAEVKLAAEQIAQVPQSLRSLEQFLESCENFLEGK